MILVDGEREEVEFEGMEMETRVMTGVGAPDVIEELDLEGSSATVFCRFDEGSSVMCCSCC